MLNRFKKWLLSLARQRAKVPVRVTTPLLLLVLAWPAQAQQVDQHNRIPNRSDFGICWWVAAEAIGKQYGIKSLEGLSAKVVANGLGFKDGAYDKTINYWLKETGTRYETNPHGKNEKGAQWVCDQLALGRPVVTCVRIPNVPLGKPSLHAVTIIKFDAGPSQSVLYLDSNNVGVTYSRPYSDWYADWYGRAYTFPGPGEPQVETPPKEPVEPPIGPPPPPPVLPTVVNLGKPIHVFPSNQDIKDGVQRPDDTLRYGVFGDKGLLSGHDYYREHNQGKRRP